mmetsp:Transcript_41150/g.66181  ORF Transcript_41150/g.66181 Transcript_41150/m.66181 type:complete len:171 (+) Transcript_41150:28-540(+)
MVTVTESHEVRTLAVLTVIVSLKFFWIIIASGGKRKRAPEDGFQPKAVSDKTSNTPLLADGNNQEQPQQQNEDGNVQSPAGFSEEERWRRLVQNDLENIPLTIMLMWIAVLCNGDKLTNIVLASLFTVGRIGHSICYIYKLMPWRSIAWLLGIVGTVGFMVNIVYGAFKN